MAINIGRSSEEPKKGSIETDLSHPSQNTNVIFGRFILIVMQAAQKAAKANLDKLSNDLKDLNGMLDKLKEGMTAAQQYQAEKAKAKDPDDVEFIAPDGFWPAVNKMKEWADANKINIDIKWIKVGNTGKHRAFIDTSDPNTLIGQLQNISQTLNNEVKVLTTKIQQANTDVNTFAEIGSALIKKGIDTGQSTLQKLS